MVNIFDFTDFRAYLQAYYNYKKEQNNRFSYQVLTQKAGLKSRGFMFNIMNGSKKMSKSHCFKLSQALGHSKKEAVYFENIVAFTQAKSNEERNHYLEEALQCKGETVTASHLIRKDQYEFYSKWYHSAIRAVIDTCQFDGDYIELSQKLSPPITPNQAKQSVRLLTRLNLIGRKDDGTFFITEQSIKASGEISQSAKNRFYLEYNDLAKNIISNLPPESRDISSLTLGISEKTYQAICKEIKSLKENIIKMANDDKEADRVYQFQYVLFPLSNNILRK